MAKTSSIERNLKRIRLRRINERSRNHKGKDLSSPDSEV